MAFHVLRIYFHGFLELKRTVIRLGVMKMHMLAAISRIYEPGIKYDIMLCLVGSQGAGKSTFFKYLAINDDWFSDNLDHLDDENIYRKITEPLDYRDGRNESNCYCKEH